MDDLVSLSTSLPSSLRGSQKVFFITQVNTCHPALAVGTTYTDGWIGHVRVGLVIVVGCNECRWIYESSVLNRDSRLTAHNLLVSTVYDSGLTFDTCQSRFDFFTVHNKSGKRQSDLLKRLPNTIYIYRSVKRLRCCNKQPIFRNTPVLFLKR